LTGVIDWTDEVVISVPVPVVAEVGLHRIPVPG
jgi:hypothetical protein